MEDNKLIAEFLGFQQTNIGWYDAEEVLLRTERDNTFDDLKFHTDWNWIMAATIECFIKLGSKNDDLNFKLNDALIETNIESLYKAVVEFIKWHNEQNK